MSACCFIEHACWLLVASLANLGLLRTRCSSEKIVLCFQNGLATKPVRSTDNYLGLIVI